MFTKFTIMSLAKVEIPLTEKTELTSTTEPLSVILELVKESSSTNFETRLVNPPIEVIIPVALMEVHAIPFEVEDKI